MRLKEIWSVETSAQFVRVLSQVCARWVAVSCRKWTRLSDEKSPCAQLIGARVVTSRRHGGAQSGGNLPCRRVEKASEIAETQPYDRPQEGLASRTLAGVVGPEPPPVGLGENVESPASKLQLQGALSFATLVLQGLSKYTSVRPALCSRRMNSVDYKPQKTN